MASVGEVFTPDEPKPEAISACPGVQNVLIIFIIFIVCLTAWGNMNIDLGGWHLFNTQENRLAFSGILPAGELKTFSVRPSLQLSNKGGLRTLLNSDDLTIDGMSYTKEQAHHAGWAITF